MRIKVTVSYNELLKDTHVFMNLNDGAHDTFVHLFVKSGSLSGTTWLGDGIGYVDIEPSYCEHIIRRVMPSWS